MIHGGGQSGSNFTGTPDGREGWAQYFLKQGYAGVCGRSGRARPIRLSVRIRKNCYLAGGHNRAALYRAGARENVAASEAAYAMARHGWLPAIPPSISSTPRQLPSIADFPKQQELNRDAGAALLDKIGPAIVLIHSQSGPWSGRLPMRDPNPGQGDRRGRTQRTSGL
jgi:hypothetical protein